MKQVKAWSICVVWDDGTEQVITHPWQNVANAIDEYCDELEEQAMVDAQESVDD